MNHGLIGCKLCLVSFIFSLARHSVDFKSSFKLINCQRHAIHWHSLIKPQRCYSKFPFPTTRGAIIMPVISLQSTVDILVLGSSLAAFFAIRGHKRKQLPYPPGPPPLPLIGNLLDIPKEFSWLSYAQLSKKHGMTYFVVNGLLTEAVTGDILSFHVFGKVIVVLNSLKANKDLLERRGDIYSDRPLIPIFDMYVFSSQVFTHGI